ncbi:YciI family protein [Stackebrandtia nassauensis]|uniref:YCII-related protein n=1 Tax=Stackebrandtia nassauensis (strain DSM 44728 / CIP 108903 / NRRL B-16338 / NBRC 102104 / LLR-40K-21) TaxID=446470 RepID=D3PVG6_STANL|nr:YciI family protein [Stackebrandtia nassauensis]ADD43080.1 YCII-related protein [Stackebrandtia nassauensis DSM 44728]
MRYMLLLNGEEPTTTPSEAEMNAEMAEWGAYDTAVHEAGIFVSSEALQPSQTATTVRLKDQERIVTDGPFVETREVLGGFYVIDVPDLDTALDWAAKCPAAKNGSVEIRPVLVFDEPEQ